MSHEFDGKQYEQASAHQKEWEWGSRLISELKLNGFERILDKRFRDLVVREMISQTKKEDGRCFETFRRINLSAEK